MPAYVFFEIYYGILAMLAYGITPGDIHIDNIAFQNTGPTILYKLCTKQVEVDQDMHVKFIDYGGADVSADSPGFKIEDIKHRDVRRILENTFEQLDKLLAEDELSTYILQYLEDEDDKISNKPAFIVLTAFVRTFMADDIVSGSNYTTKIYGIDNLWKQLGVTIV